MQKESFDLKYEIIRRRYLNRASIAFKDRGLLDKMVTQFVELDEISENDNSLRDTISKLFHLTKNITFRQNATQTFRDILQGLLNYRGLKDCKLLLSDIDHPVMKQMATTVLQEPYVNEMKLVERVIFHKSTSSKEISEFYLNEIEEHNFNIVVIPHVNWINGAKLDVQLICKDIKSLNQNIVTIVDGAQALGNSETILDKSTKEQNIDFYIGNGHKWLGCPIPVGFVRVDDRFLEIKPIRDHLFINDYFSKYAGSIKYLDEFALDTYSIPILILFKEVLNGFESTYGIFEDYYYSIKENLEPIRSILSCRNDIELLDTSIKMRTGIISLTGDLNKLSIAYKKLRDNYFSTSFNQILYNEKRVPFIRISSPFDSLASRDLELFSTCFK